MPSAEYCKSGCYIHSLSTEMASNLLLISADRPFSFADPTFMNLSESVQRSLQPINSLDKKMEKDQKDAALLMSNYQKAGHTMRKVPIEPSPSSETTGKQSRIPESLRSLILHKVCPTMAWTIVFEYSHYWKPM